MQLGNLPVTKGVQTMSNQAISYPYVEEPLPPKETMPTMYDLPDEEIGQSGMSDIFHVWQPRLLDETFRPPEL